MSRLFKTVSGLSLLAILVLLALQAFPYTGIFLMMFGAAAWVALLIHVFLISLGIEAAVRRVPRVLMIVPMLAYGGYYAAYIWQTIEIARTSAELRASNSGKVLDFDPAKQSLVTADAQIATRYAIPVVYAPNPNFEEKYLSSRLIPRDRCDVPKDGRARVNTFGVHFGNEFVKEVCQLSFPQAPDHPSVAATKIGDVEIWKRHRGITFETTELTTDGRVIGRYVSAHVWRLSEIPQLFIGCGLISSGTPAWKCGAQFLGHSTFLDTTPESVDRATLGSPESVMLGLRRLTLDDLKNFRGYGDNEAALSIVANEPKRVEEDSFVVLQKIIDGANPKVPFALPETLAKDPRRLAPFAAGMMRRFIALTDKGARLTPNLGPQQEALANAIVILPKDAFSSIAQDVFGFVQRREPGDDRFTALYIRAADLGVEALPFYEKEVATRRTGTFPGIFPILAICRIGQASESGLAELKSRFLEPSRDIDDVYKSALMVTLLKLGEEGFLRANRGLMKERPAGWIDAVLAGEGRTEIGPNNCMGKDLRFGPALTSSLRWQRGSWQANF